MTRKRKSGDNHLSPETVTGADTLSFYGQRINNSDDFIKAQLAVIRDVVAGKLSPAEARQLNRQGSAILKAVEMLCRYGGAQII